MSGALEEHIGYISDTVRTERFRRAVAEVLKPGDVVVDLGCGFGPLGLMCLEAGARRVYGIDRTDAIEIARETAARAGFASEYICIRERSFLATIPEKADVIICDHVGYFGFDYGIIEMLDDARARFLKSRGKTIPSQISLQTAGVSSERCREQAEAWGSLNVPPEFRWLRDYGVNCKYKQAFRPAELPTTTNEIVSIDLTIDSPERLSGSAVISGKADGSMTGLAGWFSATLSPGASMTNSPLDPRSISRDQAYLPFDEPLEMKAGDAIRVDVDAHHATGIIAWAAENLRTSERRSQTNWRSQIIAERDRIPQRDRIVDLGPAGTVEAALVALVDGERTARDIEELILRDYSDRLPSRAAIREFVRKTIARLER